MGDFKARMGTQDYEAETAIAPHGLVDRNDRARTLIDFQDEHDLYTINMSFRKRFMKWLHPEGRTRNAIDFIINSRKDIVKDVSILNKFSTVSDH